MPDTHLGDVSEFQEELDAAVYIAGGHSCLIVRAHNGHRPDHQWPGRRDYLRRYPFTALGYYQYVVASRPAGDQAREFVACVGSLRPNEFAVCDLEEGSGDQSARADAWFRVVDAWAGFPASLYSGESFFQTQLGGARRWRGRPRWMAAYRSTEPTAPHELWQNTNQARFLGIPGVIDGNVFHGTDHQFAHTFCAQPVLPVALPTGTQSVDVQMMTDGRQEIFIELKSGEVMHRWNAREGGWVEGWHSLGRPGG